VVRLVSEQIVEVDPGEPSVRADLGSVELVEVVLVELREVLEQWTVLVRECNEPDVYFRSPLHLR
jgi:hypothetical protein